MELKSAPIRHLKVYDTLIVLMASGFSDSTSGIGIGSPNNALAHMVIECDIDSKL